MQTQIWIYSYAKYSSILGKRSFYFKDNLLDNFDWTVIWPFDFIKAAAEFIDTINEKL